MPKTWKPGEERRFTREIELNRPYYIVYSIAQNMAPWEDAQLYSEIVFTKRLPFTRTPCTAHGAAADHILRTHGPVHDTPPRGMRNIADAARSVGAPLGSNYRGILDEAELRGLEKLAAQTSNPRTRGRR
ncbi:MULTISPECIES: hypothetical protein [Streptomyces]|uniref:Uncharacterized protein n=2 Tax=Streptomyces TaxID=1883 RepID=A0A2U9NZ11_STRAS|nr:hypothetical protein [Streptomyces actuosus]AWT42577.1 hypothetical protein DMT42_09790 [Streptomyces actuosus]MBM4819784.1 hypothetical protein [Streptomyces actuosus]